MIENIPRFSTLSTSPTYYELQRLLTGKQLLSEELSIPIDQIQQYHAHGYLAYRNGIIRKPLSCTRCGTTDSSWFAELPCARCGKVELYCRKCLMMGRISECTTLISWTGPDLKFRVVDIPLLWDGQLSAGQAAASQRVLEAVQNSAELLVWAVAGAGKTEVLFAGIANALSTGKRVCVATPRTDVVLELAPRLQKVFPDIKVAALFGGSEDRHEFAQITIATTHQLLRFYKAFDVMIVDEVDAFPYSIDETLRYAVQQSRKPESSLIYLTATPNKQWQRECRSGIRDCVTIPARFHRHPLPVPHFVWSGNWERQLKKGKLNTSLKKWVESRIASRKQVMIFAPKIDLMDKILIILRALTPLIESVHAEDPDRKEKVLRFRNKEIPILLTTTILERGVTIPNIDVAVIGTENRIFTESALVQIAGRAGRSAEYPKGDVTFFHYGKTEAMLSARRQIVMMNKAGIEKGLIDV
ncbi:DEAD/DEAH box helicase [Cytobacillus oceanisediminis]|uniref:DEAD/DEAH box helicase n=1 Tax=Cytobacillus oceanisediminis TaxID=665099 RepID=UPI0011AA98B6